jgi:hypothetical protein
VVVLGWTDGGLYDRILVYRDGRLLTQLPGTATGWVDDGSAIAGAPGLRGDRRWAVRGCIRQSKSVPATIAIAVGPSSPAFKRGDVNSDGREDISDGIALLGYLFLGSTAPECLRAADCDGSGLLDITDAVYLLGHLFLGGPPPRAPFPDCGVDPAEGALPCPSHAACR